MQRMDNMINTPTLLQRKNTSIPVRKWRRWIKVLIQELHLLNKILDVRKKFYLVLEHSHIKHEQSDFWLLAFYSFNTEPILRYVRFCEPQSKNKRVGQQVITLSSFLSEVAKFHSELTRKRYVHRNIYGFRRPATKEGKARLKALHRLRNNEFDALAGMGSSSFPLRIIKADQIRIKKIYGQFNKYRHKHLAHIAVNRRSIKKVPSMVNVYSGVDELNKILNKYYQLIFRSYFNFKPHTTSLTWLFNKAWLTDRNTIERIKDRENLKVEGIDQHFEALTKQD